MRIFHLTPLVELMLGPLSIRVVGEESRWQPYPRNLDNKCLIRATLVAMASACKVHPVEFRRIKALHPTYTTGEILIHFSRCPTWYYEDLRANKKKVREL